MSIVQDHLENSSIHAPKTVLPLRVEQHASPRHNSTKHETGGILAGKLPIYNTLGNPNDLRKTKMCWPARIVVFLCEMLLIQITCLIVEDTRDTPKVIKSEPTHQMVL